MNASAERTSKASNNLSSQNLRRLGGGPEYSQGDAERDRQSHISSVYRIRVPVASRAQASETKSMMSRNTAVRKL